MSWWKSSLRGKIRAGFVLSFSFLLLVASIMFVNLLVVEDQVALHAGISRFLDTTLEMRRYEKNYLLYGKREDLETAMDYADSAAAQFGGEVRNRDIPVHDLAMITAARAVSSAERVLGAVVALRSNQRRKLVLAELFADLGA